MLWSALKLFSPSHLLIYRIRQVGPWWIWIFSEHRACIDLQLLCSNACILYIKICSDLTWSAVEYSPHGTWKTSKIQWMFPTILQLSHNEDKSVSWDLYLGTGSDRGWRKSWFTALRRKKGKHYSHFWQDDGSIHQRPLWCVAPFGSSCIRTPSMVERSDWGPSEWSLCLLPAILWGSTIRPKTRSSAESLNCL